MTHPELRFIWSFSSSMIRPGLIKTIVEFPVGAIAFALLLINVAWYWRDFRKRPRPGFCRNCGYDLRATPDRCPECGHQPETADL